MPTYRSFQVLSPFTLALCAGCALADPTDDTSEGTDPSTLARHVIVVPTDVPDFDVEHADFAQAPSPLSPEAKAALVTEAQTAFSLQRLTVNEDEVFEVTVDAPRIVDRAALGTRYMSWNDPETSGVADGAAKFLGGGTQNPYVRLRVDASFGELYLVDCRVTEGTYQITVQDVSGMGGGSQGIETDSDGNGHIVYAFDPGPGGYKQIYMQRDTGKTSSWSLWGCQVTPLI